MFVISCPSSLEPLPLSSLETEPSHRCVFDDRQIKGQILYSIFCTFGFLEFYSDNKCVIQTTTLWWEPFSSANKCLLLFCSKLIFTTL